MAETTVLDDYELLNCLATGNSTQVWEVRHKSNGQSFAMKLLLPESFTDAEQKKALKAEYAVGKSLDHPNLIRFFDLTVTRDHGYFIMEFFRSANLKQMIRGERAAVQSRAKKILEGVALGIAHMHEKNWIHKDLKPENILATKGSEVKVIDFSLASRPSGALTKLMGGSKNMVIQGTRTYLAPELIRRKPLTVAADIYSLGITFYEICTGRPPFIHGNPNDLLMAHVRDTPEKPSGYNPNVTPEADAMILRLLSKKPENRPKSMMDVAAELRNLKIFKEEPEAHARELATKAQEKFDDSIAGRLDSRSDAARDKTAPPPPPKPKPKPAPPVTARQPAKPAPKEPAAPAPVAAAPQMPGYPPGYPPQPFPGQYPPGYPQPMPYFPGMPPSGMPQGMPAAGQAPPGWPQGYPLQQMPPGFAFPPGYPAAAGAVPAAAPPATAAPAPPAAVAPAPPSPAKSPPAPAPAPAVEDEDSLPMMTELPDVL